MLQLYDLDTDTDTDLEIFMGVYFLFSNNFFSILNLMSVTSFYQTGVELELEKEIARELRTMH